jgi:type II secretory pathway component PulF
MSTPAPAESAAQSAESGIVRTFKYEAQALDGKRVTGLIDAESAEWVAQRLGLLRLRLVRLDPVRPVRVESAGPDADAGLAAADGLPRHPHSRPGRALRGDDFIAFNQQLAHLAKAGLPIESGLRLIAREMRSGRLAQTLKSVADELDRGVPLGEAFTKHRGQFPSLYGRLLDAGVASGDLAGVLLGFGAHLQMLQRLRSALWRSVSYPLAVLAALAVVLLFLGHYVIPRFGDLYAGFTGTPVYNRFTGNFQSLVLELPVPTKVLFAASQAVPWVAALLLAAIVLGPVAWQVLRLRGWDRHVVDVVALRLPLIGRPIRLNLVARWCDALRIGVRAGLPLPKAIALTGDAIRSPRLRLDGGILITRLEKGRSLSSLGNDLSRPENRSEKLAILPATVPVALELASGHNDLAATLSSLTELYERQAELRVNSVPAVLTPLLVIVVACTIGFVILGLTLPLIRIIDELTRIF